MPVTLAHWLSAKITATKKARFILHDTTHPMAADSDYCPTCGQLIQPPAAYGSETNKNRKIILGVTVLLHVLVALYAVFHSDKIEKILTPKKESAMVYITPMKNTPPSQPEPKPKPTPKPKDTKVAKVKPPPSPSKPVVTKNTPSTKPKLETFTPPVVSKVPLPPPPAEDMATMIEQRRQQRQAQQPAPPAEESDNDRAIRIAKANIAGAQGRNSGSDSEDSGGVFSIVNQTSFSAEVKFRGWNGNFKRNWLKQERVDIGNEPDIESAIIKKMIQLIRAEKPGDFVWESRRLGRNVNLSARVEDTAELTAFLRQEFFSEKTSAPRRR